MLLAHGLLDDQLAVVPDVGGRAPREAEAAAPEQVAAQPFLDVARRGECAVAAAVGAPEFRNDMGRGRDRLDPAENGRASCRERGVRYVSVSVVAGSRNK